MTNWLAEFAYRIDLGVAPFLLATVVALGLSVLVIVSQSASVAVDSPVDMLRYE